MDTITCSQCFNVCSVHDESKLVEWTCPVCDGSDYFVADTDDLYDWGYHEEDDGDRLREY